MLCWVVALYHTSFVSQDCSLLFLSRTHTIIHARMRTHTHTHTHIHTHTHAACDKACKDMCTGAGPGSCEECASGYVEGEEGVCEDEDECKEDDSLCEEGTYCFNMPGTYKCNGRSQVKGHLRKARLAF